MPKYKHRAVSQPQAKPQRRSKVIYNLCYVSTPAQDLSKEELARIVKAAQKNNQAKSISGVLLYKNETFLQVLEGDQSEVDAVFNSIQGDLRHHSIKILRRGFASQRFFKDWHMEFKDLKQAGLGWIEDLLGLEEFEDDYFEILGNIREKDA